MAITRLLQTHTVKLSREVLCLQLVQFLFGRNENSDTTIDFTSDKRRT